MLEPYAYKLERWAADCVCMKIGVDCRCLTRLYVVLMFIVVAADRRVVYCLSKN